MNKREVVFNGMAAGTLGLIMAGTGGKSVFAEEMNWRDELLETHKHHQIYYKNTHDPYVKKDSLSHSIYIFENSETENYEVSHTEYLWPAEPNEDGSMTAKELYREETYFPTLKEAYQYAKQLKEKHYG
jgi:hypothetical protein